MDIILGSQSPRRKEILFYFGLPFICVSPDIDEKKIPFDQDPEKYACIVAEKKAEEIQKNYPEKIILSADTIVYKNKTLYTKPTNEKEAFAMLNDLSGSWHTVYTGVCVKNKEKTFSQTEATKILFHPLTPTQIKKYHNKFFYLDKAGGYAIQEGGSIIVKKIEGCFYNIMGLPITTTKELLLKAGIDLWDYLE